MSRYGCNRKPGSGMVFDQCGECNGDGKTCLGCDKKPNSGAFIGMFCKKDIIIIIIVNNDKNNSF